MKNERNYGIDLLRLVLMLMICIQHILGQGGILSASTEGTLRYKIFWFLEIFSTCAVDGFAIISGYMAVNKTYKYEKIVNMWFQAFFYSFILTGILTIAGINDGLGGAKFDVIRCAMPVTFGKFWYFTAYFALFFAIPILNKYIFEINENFSKKMFIILIILFSVMGILGDPFKSQAGYSAIWLIVLYCIGALAKKIRLFKDKKSITLIFFWMICILVTWGIYIFIDIGRLTNYISPTILLSGMIMVILFSRLHLKGTIIAKISPLTFGIYLFQCNQIIWNNIIKGAFAFVASQNIVIGVMYVFLFAFIIFILGLIVEFIRSNLMKFFKIPLLSKRLVIFIDIMLNKLFIFLK